MSYYTLYIYLIILVKLIFIFLALAYLHYSRKKTPTKQDKLKTQQLEFWKKRMEFIFITLMSLLLIYLFRRPNHIIDYETSILLFLFGIILLITADWTTFFKESDLFKQIQSITGK